MRTSILLLLAAWTLPMTAGAQQLRPFAVDRITSKNGLLIYKGVSYVSVDLLKQAGATPGSKGLYLYTQPTPAGPTLKLSGCLNQKLYNNAFVLMVKAPSLQPGDPGQGAAWLIPYTVQPVSRVVFGNARYGFSDVDLTDAILTYKDGTRWTERTTPVAKAEVDGFLNGFERGTIGSGTMVFRRDENEVEANPPVRLALPPTRINDQTYPGLTIDLSCSK